jgi:hypothetical protein
LCRRRNANQTHVSVLRARARSIVLLLLLRARRSALPATMSLYRHFFLQWFSNRRSVVVGLRADRKKSAVPVALESVAPTPPLTRRSNHLHRYECCPRCSFTNKVCNGYYDMDTCPKKCEWHMREDYCSALGSPVPCHLFHDQYKCPSHRCTWHEAAV